MDISVKEKDALMKKAENRKESVLCPRCGKPLEYREVGASYEVKCPTEGCIKMAVRGL